MNRFFLSLIVPVVYMTIAKLLYNGNIEGLIMFSTFIVLFGMEFNNYKED